MPAPDQSFSAPRGMRDFYPEEMALRTRIFSAWTAAARLFGFAQYDACVVESLELLKRKSGEEIVDQIYAFKDKSDRELALRPEMTPSLARMIIARQGQLAFPLKWFAIPQCFRYERMSRGRKREHYQWNLDIVGEPSRLAEAEILATAIKALELLGLGPDDVRIHVSSRALLAELLERASIPRDFHAATFLALDKRGKVDDITPFLGEAGLSAANIEAVMRILSLSSLDEAAALAGDASPSVAALRELFEMLGIYGLERSAAFDISVIRGLGYYTGIVFEAFDLERKFRAVFGGGRYDNLLSDLGGRPMTAVGLGFGDVVIAELLEDRQKAAAAAEPLDLAIGYMEEAQRTIAMALARQYRGQGRRVDLALHAEKARAFFARVGAGCFVEAAYMGPDDMVKRSLRLKNLATREERSIGFADLGL